MVAGPRGPAPGNVGGGSLIREATAEAIAEAASALRAGKLVGMPTETVYGIAADALSPSAIVATYELKRRPADNPLIVHVSGPEMASELASVWPKEARVLAESFWPGPLTLVLPKRDLIPSEATAGLPSVALRAPAHLVAARLIGAFGGPLTAPSANPFMGLSPTQATDIDPFIERGLAMILDGGPCEVGIESTVVDLSSGPPNVLRLGTISLAQIREILPDAVHELAERKAPGMYPRHYAPQTPLRIATKAPADAPALVFGEPGFGQIRMPSDPAAYARRLYAALAELDRHGADTIYAEAPPTGPEWDAVRDRLRKASTADR